MPKIRDFSLPPALVDQLVEDLETMPEDLLLAWGRDCLPGSFTRPDAIRSRLVMQVKGEGPLEPRLLSLLALSFPLRSTVAALSLPYLQQFYASMAVLAGPESLLLAILFDPREEVYRWGVEQAAKPVPVIEGDAEMDAEDEIYNFLYETFADPLGVVLENSVPQEPARELIDKVTKGAMDRMSGEIQAQKKSIERLNNELQQQKQRHLARLKDENEAADRAKKALRSELVQAQQQAAALRREKTDLEAKLRELNQRIEDEVAKAVREQTSALTRKWLSEPVELERAKDAETGRTGDLLSRAREALEAQAQLDRHTGNRIELEKQLNELRSAHGQITSALQAAITPIPQLRSLSLEIEAAIGRLEKVLGGRPASSVTSSLLAQINQVTTWDEARSLAVLADQLADYDFIPREERRAVYNQLQRKFSLLAETNRSKPVEVESGWSLRDTLFRNKSALLLLDGHNILYGLPDIFSADYDNGHPGQRARQRLIGLAEKLLKNRSNIKAKLCFDGPDPRSLQVIPNLSVEYSGGTGKNRADEMIVSRLQFKELESLDQKVFVVTDDRQIRSDVLKTGAKFVRNDLFAVLLADFQCL